MSIQEDWPNDHTPRRGMSTTAKVLLVLAGMCALCFIAVCGVVVFFVFQFKGMVDNASSTDPAIVRQVTAEIADINIPETFEPKQSMKMEILKSGMTMVMYQDKTSAEGNLMLMEFSSSFGGDPAKQQAEMEKAFQQQGIQNPGIKMEEVKLHDIEIRSKTSQFQFIKGTTNEGETAIRRVSGQFSGKRGIAILMLTIPEDQYDEQAIVEMLQTIK